MPALPLGPRPLSGEKIPLAESDVAPIINRQGASIPGDVLRGILGPFNGRARTILLSLLQGSSLGMAAASAGISKNALDDWRQKDHEFGTAVALAYDLGFSSTYEAELYDRALDREDRGSMRALELVVKARSPDYREKSQLQLEIVRQVGNAFGQLAGGYEAPALPADSE